MPNKLTDIEIVKALEYCTNYDECGTDCPCFSEQVNMCGNYNGLLKQALDLINRLQARVELLDTKLGIKELEYSMLERERAEDIGKFAEELKSIKAEAYKECIEKVKVEIAEALKSNYKARSERAQSIPIYTEDEFWNYCAGKIDCLRGLDDFCDNLLKELVGDSNEN